MRPTSGLSRPMVGMSETGLGRLFEEFFVFWFIFVGLLAAAMIAGSAYVVYLLLDHFGVIVMGLLV